MSHVSVSDLPPTPPGCRLYARFGDAGDYEDVGAVVSMPDALNDRGIKGPIERYNEYGIDAVGYTHQNYISVYFGTDVETPVRGLTDDEIDYIDAHTEQEVEEEDEEEDDDEYTGSSWAERPMGPG